MITLSEMETTVEIGDIDYSNKVFKLIIDMKPGESFIINLNVHPKNRVRFIETVKLFIECDYGRHLGGYYIEFNSDYSKIRKQNYF